MKKPHFLDCIESRVISCYDSHVKIPMAFTLEESCKQKSIQIARGEIREFSFRLKTRVRLPDHEDKDLLYQRVQEQFHAYMYGEIEKQLYDASLSLRYDDPKRASEIIEELIEVLRIE